MTTCFFRYLLSSFYCVAQSRTNNRVNPWPGLCSFAGRTIGGVIGLLVSCFILVSRRKQAEKSCLKMLLDCRIKTDARVDLSSRNLTFWRSCIFIETFRQPINGLIGFLLNLFLVEFTEALSFEHLNDFFFFRFSYFLNHFFNLSTYRS